MLAAVAVDSGPLVALFDRDDSAHERAFAWIQRSSGRLVSTVAVVTEVVYLLDFSPQVQIDFLRWLARGALILQPLSGSDFERIAEVMDKYRDLPADFADASLLAVCERLDVREVASMDRDFDIYRFRNRIRFRNVFPRI
jgi:uncharacterized protein